MMWRPLRHLRVYQALGWAILGSIVTLSLMSRPPQGPDVPMADKWEHLLAYGSLMFWWGQLALGRTRSALALAFIALGGAVELLQGMGGVRMAEWGDFIANSLGVALGYAFSQGRLGRVLEAWEQKGA